VYANAAVVFHEAELAKAVHEGIDVRAGAADHAGEGLLRDLRNQRIVFAGTRVIREEQEGTREALLRAVEELIDEIGLGLHAAG
jgi:hypothetical protein